MGRIGVYLGFTNRIYAGHNNCIAWEGKGYTLGVLSIYLSVFGLELHGDII